MARKKMFPKPPEYETSVAGKEQEKKPVGRPLKARLPPPDIRVLHTYHKKRIHPKTVMMEIILSKDPVLLAWGVVNWSFHEIIKCNQDRVNEVKSYSPEWEKNMQILFREMSMNVLKVAPLASNTEKDIRKIFEEQEEQAEERDQQNAEFLKNKEDGV